MSGQLLTWTDFFRLAKAVSYDDPKNQKEIADWTRSLLLVNSSALSIINASWSRISKDPPLRGTIVAAILAGQAGLDRALMRFPEWGFAEVLKEAGEALMQL